MTSKILVIDHGNTSLKASVFSGTEQVAAARFAVADIERVAAFAAPYEPAAGIYSAVARMDVRFIESLRCLLPGGLMVLTYETPLPITTDYLTPKTLGADRVAAAVGAAALFPGRSALIADAGTALTLDVVDAEGCFRGGNISPGAGMRLKALHEHTGRLPLADLSGDVTCFGRSTDEALRNGAVRGVAYEILGALDDARRLYGCSLLILTGGDSSLIRPLLSTDIEIITSDALVAVGLNCIFRYNETI